MKKKKEPELTVAQKRRMAAKKYAESLEKKESDSGDVENKMKKEPMSKKKKTIIGVSVVCLVLIVVIVVGAIVNSILKSELFGGYDNTLGDVVLDEEMDGIYTCLLVATDKSKVNTDTIMLAVVRYEDVKRVDLISIPRDTRVLNPNGKGGYVKINSIMARNNGKINSLVEEVRNITGIPINDFMLVDIEAVKRTVDMFGGVMFDVPMDMDYDDPLQGLSIHLKKGMQLIDGNKAEQLLRFRYGYADADLGRTKVQREFLMAAFKQHAKASNIGKLSDWYSEMEGYVQTKVTYEKAYKLASVVVADDFSIQSHILPGTVITGSPDYFYNAQKINELAKELGFGENPVKSTPNPSVNSNSGTSFGEEKGPASTIHEEIPVETVEPTSTPDSNGPTKTPNDNENTDDDDDETESSSSPSPTKTPADDETVPTKSPKPTDTSKPKPSPTEKPQNTPEGSSGDNGGYPDGI